MARIIEARVRQKKDTLEGWMSNDLVLLDGEQAFVLNANGREVNYKLGDGTKRFSELEFMIQYDQAAYVAPAGNTLPVPQNGIGYSILTEGSYNGGAIVVPSGNLGVASYSGSWVISRTMAVPKGDKGDKGDQGNRGIQGVRGLQGIQGIQGIQGAQGIQGVRGLKGDKGDGIELSGSVNNYSDLSSITPTPSLGDTYVVNSTGLMYVYGSSGFPPQNQGIQFINKSVYSITEW